MVDIRRLAAIAILAALAGCATRPHNAGAFLPLTGARIGADGMATIAKVPPTPFPDEPPPQPAPAMSLIETYARDNGISVAQAEAEINGDAEFQRVLADVTAKLRQDHPANFAGVRIVRDPRVAAEFSFKRDGAATLARYTRNPQFRAVDGGRSEAEMQQLADLWIKRMQQENLPALIGSDPFSGRITIEPGISETEWRALADARGWNWGQDVALRFVAPAPPPQTEAGAFPFHIFPRSRAAATIVLTSATTGTVTLQQGCFRLGGKGAPLALFDRSAQIGRDRQGYLALFENGKPAGRIGERMVWGGYPGADERDPDVVALRRACGTAPIVNVGLPQSARLFALPDPSWVTNYAAAKKIGYTAAWKRIIDCMQRRADEGAEGLELRTGCYDQYN